VDAARGSLSFWRERWLERRRFGAYQDVVSEQEMIAGTQRARAEESALWHSSFSDGTAAMRTRARRMSYLRMSYL
jgi:hypothetical protein